MEVLDESTWQARAAAHADARRRVGRSRTSRAAGTGVKHPVHDFLFTYYSQRPAALRRWHPGWGVVLLDAPEYADQKGYPASVVEERSVSERLETTPRVTSSPLIESIHRLLVATAGRTPTLGCFGLHEWAMVHRRPPARSATTGRCGSGARGTDEVVEPHRIALLPLRRVPVLHRLARDR